MAAALRHTGARLLCVVVGVALTLGLPAPAFAVVEPLSDYVPVTSVKLSEDIDENWSFSTNRPYWSVLAVRPSPGWDVITDVAFDGTAGFVRSTPNGILGVNFIAIDSNGGRRPFGPYFGRAITATPPPNWPGGASPYTIMHAQGASIIYPGTTTITWAPGVFLVVRDIYLTAGQQITVTINRGDMAYLFASDPANSATWVQPRDRASTRTTSGRMRYTAPVSAWYGLVLVNGRGTASLTVRIGTT
jgi:hypothetical protein